MFSLKNADGDIADYTMMEVKRDFNWESVGYTILFSLCVISIAVTTYQRIISNQHSEYITR